ncbi:tripartite motif-containing protein 2-like [Glandiceps talaboti]
MASEADYRFFDKISEKFLLCSICSERYKNAKILPCIHTFCQHCLSKWVTTAGILECPVCRRSHRLPDGGVASLQSNFFVNNLVEEFDQRDTGSTESKGCDGCLTENSDRFVWCIECSMKLCDNCARTHGRLPSTRTHRLISLDEYQSVKSKDPTMVPVQSCVYCDKHPENQVKFFCETCEVPICSDCTVVDHRVTDEHKHKYLKDAAAGYKKEVTMMVNKLKEKEKEATDSTTTIQQMSDALDVSFNTEQVKVKEHMTKTIQEITRIIQSNGEQLLKQLNDEYEARKTTLQAQLKELGGSQNDMSSVREFAENLTEYGNPAQLMATKKGVTVQTQQLLDLQTKCTPAADDFMVFKPNDDFCATKSLGSVTLFEVKLQSVDTYYRIGEDVRGTLTVKSGTKVSVKDINATITVPGGKLESMNVTDNNNETFSVSSRVKVEGEHELSVSVCGKPVHGSPVTTKVIPQKGLVYTIGKKGTGEGEVNGPWGLALTEKGDLLVCERENDRLQSFTLPDQCGRVITNTGYTHQFYPCYVAMSRDGKMRYVTETNKNQVLVFDVNWKFKKSLKGEINTPKGIAISPINNHVYVVDESSHCIRIQNQDGQQLKYFGSQGSGKGNLSNPEDVCINSRGNVIVSDYGNHRMQVYDADGNFSFTFGNQGNKDSQLSLPYGVDTDKHDNVYVCDSGNKRVLKFDSKGNFICRIDSEKDGLKCPIGIYVTDDEPFGKVIVADYYGHCVKVFAQ